jgi:orotate phosphoribosyltransferase
LPSSDHDRDEHHALHRILRGIAPTQDRYERLLVRSDEQSEGRIVDPAKYAPTRRVDGESILLVDDTWTTGANVSSAAGALKAAGARRVGVVVVGRHINLEFDDN